MNIQSTKSRNSWRSPGEEDKASLTLNASGGSIRQRNTRGNSLIDRDADRPAVLLRHVYDTQGRETLNAKERLDFVPIGQGSEAYMRERRNTNSFMTYNIQKDRKRWLLTTLVGFLTGFSAFLITLGVKEMSELKFRLANLALRTNFVWGFLTLAAFNALFVCIAGALTAFVAPPAAGSGIPAVKAWLNGSKTLHLLALKTLFVKMTGAALAVSGGLYVGKEGPMVHAGSILASNVTRGRSKTLNVDTGKLRDFRNDADSREFVSCGAAAGVSAAFGAPIGGILFSLEEASSFWSARLTWRAFWASCVSTFTLNLFLTGYLSGWKEFGNFNVPGLITFNVSDSAGYEIWQLPAFVILGLIGGLLGSLFSALNVRLTRWRRVNVPKTSPKKRLVEVMSAVVLTTVLCGLLPVIYGECYPVGDFQKITDGTLQEVPQIGQFTCEKDHYNPLAVLLWNPQEASIQFILSRHTSGFFHPGQIIVTMVVIFICSCYTYGTAVPSGLFVPLILVGAQYGRLMGMSLKYLWPDQDIDNGTFALLGAASMLGGTVRMTISLTVIVLEITNDIKFLLPIMMVIMTSKSVGDRINMALYDAHIGLSYTPMLEPECPSFIPVFAQARDVMSAPVVSVRAETMTVEDILRLLNSCRHNGFPVVGGVGGQYAGMILRHQLLVLIQEKIWLDHNLTLPTSIFSNDRHFRDQYKPTASDFDLDERDLASKLNLSAYMTPSALVVAPSYPLTSTYMLFRSLGLRHLCIVDEKKQIPVGMITTKCLLEEDLEHKFHHFELSDEDFEARLKQFHQPSSRQSETTAGRSNASRV